MSARFSNAIINTDFELKTNQLQYPLQSTISRLDTRKSIILEMTSFASEEFFWGGQIGVPRYIGRCTDLEFLDITRLELRSVERKHRPNCSCAYTYAAAVLIISLHVHRLSINLLIDFGSSAKNEFIRYLCFIVVDFIRSCHHRLKMSSFSLKKNKLRSIDLSSLAGDRRNHCVYNCSKPWILVLGKIWSKGDSSYFENSPSFQISWTWSDIFRINENFN